MLEKYALHRIIQCLRKHETVSVRSAAKHANVGVATAKRWLDYLHEKNLVNLKIFGKMYQYTFNQQNILVRQMKITYSVAEIQESGLVAELLINHPAIISIVLFGSVANGTDTPKSDIDILIISTKPIIIKPLKAKLPRELNIIAYPISYWRKKAVKEKPFYDGIISNSIILHGELPVVV